MGRVCGNISRIGRNDFILRIGHGSASSTNNSNHYWWQCHVRDLVGNALVGRIATMEWMVGSVDAHRRDLFGRD